MKKLHLKVSGRLFIANICSYVGFYILDVVLFHTERVMFTSFYGYLLFPLFSIACGLFSYKKLKQVVLPNILYYLFCFLFLIVFTGIGMFLQNDFYIITASLPLQKALYSMPIIGLCAMISVVFSIGLSIATSLIAKYFYKKSR